MGIQGLLPLLKSIQKQTHLRNFAGQTLGVDAYGWLHRGTVACAIELAQQKPTRKHIDFALSRVRMLIHFGVKPYLVFDGAYLPSKEHTEKERASKRNESRKLGLELLSMNRLPQAYLELQKAIDVTPSMARELIEELKQLDVPYVVAPYEADSQLAYLEKQNVISGIISEDSDLLVFGVKCLLTKLDQYGECVMVNRADFTACREISLVGWTDREFRMMAMLSGCDYLPGIDQLGLKTAYRLVRQHKTIERVVRAIQFDGKKKVPPGYLEAFTKAERTFLYQWVFCPEARHLVHLNNLPAELKDESMPFLGEDVDHEIAVGVAIADLDPNTKEKLTFNHIPRPLQAIRSQPVQTPDEKPGKSITEFFKPVRTPLAELDPNSFTPSPSQQALLERQQGASWSASQIQAMRPPGVRRAATVNFPSSAPQVARRTQSAQLSSMLRRSPKRQRLCSDAMLAASMDGTTELRDTTSRFFKSKDEQSPSLSKPKGHRRKSTDFEIFSDDSAGDAMAEITAAEEVTAVVETPAPKKRKKIQVFADGRPEVIRQENAASSSAPNSSQDTASAPEFSQKTLLSETQDTSLEVEEKRNVLRRGVDEEFAGLRERFDFRTTSPRKNLSRAKSTPLIGRSASVLNGGLDSGTKHTTPSKHHRDISNHDAPPEEEEIEEETALITNSSPPRDQINVSPDLKQHSPLDEDEAAGDIVRQSDPAAEWTIQGSEDFLIPNSPQSEEGNGANRRHLNLGQFLFAGTR